MNLDGGRRGREPAKPTATVTGYLARRIDRARKNNGGVAPERMSVAPEVFEDLVAWWRRKSRFDQLLGRGRSDDEEENPASIIFDGVEIFADEYAPLPRSADFLELYHL